MCVPSKEPCGDNQVDGSVMSLTPADVKLRGASKEQCWITVDSKVYDVTDWMARHPGGKEILLMYSGEDATDVFHAFHPPHTFKRLKTYHIGDIKPGTEQVSEVMKDFRALKDKLWQEGWFEPEVGFHWRVVAIALACLGACLGLLHFGNQEFVPPVAKLLIVCFAGVCLAQFWQQSLLIAHDACHTGITRNRTVDSLIGQIAGTLCSGIGATWWTKDHNEHHAVTNQVESDRGGDRTSGALPVMTVHELQLEVNLKGKGPLPNGGKPLTGQQPWYWVLLKLQCWIYFPVMLVVARFNLHIISVVLATKDKRLALDVGLIFGFMYITWNICQMAPEGYRWSFYWSAHVMVSVLHMIIGMNHFHLPMYNAVPSPEDGGWLKHQTATTSNISGGAFINWYCGGLQNQIEHHLFPQMPRSRHAKLKPLVQALCKKHSVEYQEYGFFKSNVLVMDVLWRVTNSPLSQLTVSPGHFKAH